MGRVIGRILKTFEKKRIPISLEIESNRYGRQVLMFWVLGVPDYPLGRTETLSTSEINMIGRLVERCAEIEKVEVTVARNFLEPINVDDWQDTASERIRKRLLELQVEESDLLAQRAKLR